ncbi:MAG: MMPL family transporter [Bacteroidia bacterium]|nr:MMPL family transporter [Bacteroidia bacterium]
MNWLLQRRQYFIWIIVGITVLMAIGLSQLRISFSFESFYPKDDQEYQYHSMYRFHFSEDQNYMIYLAVKSPSDDIFDKEFLEKADELFSNLRNIEGVDSMISATSLQKVRRRGINVSSRPYLKFDSQEALEESRQLLGSDSTLIGSFISRDKKYVCGYAFIDPEIFDSPKRDGLVQEVEAKAAESGLQNVISGIPYIRTKYVETIGGELLLFLSMSILLITTVLVITYRNFWGVILPQIAVILALVWILGFMGATGQGIDLISSLLIPIMFVVGVSDVIHLTTKYLREFRLGKSREEAMLKTLKEIGFSIFLTSVTTAVGFASLVVSRIIPIKNFGLYAAAGVMFTYLITILILPYALMKIDPRKFMVKSSLENHPLWDRWMDALYHWTKKYPYRILAGTGVILAACFWLIFQIPTDSHLIEDIGKNDPIRKSMEFFEEQTYGLRPFELGIHVKGDSAQITDKAVLIQLDKIQNYLNSREEFGPFLSAATVVKEANYIYRNNRERYRAIPKKQEQIDDLLAFVEINANGSIMEKLMTEDGKMGRISSTMADIGTNALDTLYADLQTFVSTECDTSLFYYKATGHAYLTERNLVYVRWSLLGGLSIAFVVVGFIMGLLFRSGKMLLISMAPNVIPLILTGGVMGLFNITLTASTALVFVIAFGIAVDDTIHFLSRYRLERQKGLDVDAAILETLRGTGKAMILTSLILMGGFILLLASDFGGTYNTGLFTGLTIIFAMFADLLLLPILLRLSKA